MHHNLQYFLKLWNLTLEEAPLKTITGLIAKIRWNDHPCILKIATEEGDEETASLS